MVTFVPKTFWRAEATSVPIKFCMLGICSSTISRVYVMNTVHTKPVTMRLIIFNV